MKPGASIINTASINADRPSPQLLPYATTKGAGADLDAAPPSTMPPEKVENFGKDTPLGRPGQPAELAGVFVLLASGEASYISGARLGVTGGAPIL